MPVTTYRCEAEIGSVKHGWHVCNRPAVVESVRAIAGAQYSVRYCQRHQERAQRTDSRLVTVREIRACVLAPRKEGR